MFVFRVATGNIGFYRAHKSLLAICGISDALREEDAYFHIVNYDLSNPVELKGDAFLFWEDIQVLSKKIIKQKKELIVLNRVPPDFTGNCVIHDDRLDFSLATRHLIQAGHRNIAFVYDTTPSVVTCQARVGIEETMREHGLPFGDAQCHEVNDTSENWEKAVENIKKSGITGIISLNDIVGYKLLEASSRCGIKVPAELSLIGNNSISAPPHFSTQLTSIQTPWYEIARRGTELLMKVLHSKSKIRSTVREIIESQIYEGETVAKS